MELAVRRYTLFPICYITAVVGTLIVSEISAILCKFIKISKCISYLEKNSLYMLCIHCFDNEWSYIWSFTDFSLLNAICRVTVDLILFIFFMFIKEKRLSRLTTREGAGRNAGKKA
jgi:fucose 4-O-acetylase-like acetyltransferase